MSKVIINARIDESLKKKLETIAKEMGLSLSSLVSASLTKLAQESTIQTPMKQIL